MASKKPKAATAAPQFSDKPMETDYQKVKGMTKMISHPEVKERLKVMSEHENEDDVLSEEEAISLPTTTQKFVVETAELREKSLKELRHLIDIGHPVKNKDNDVPLGNPDDTVLLRMLRGRKFDVPRAYDLLKAHEAGKVKYNLGKVNINDIQPLVDIGYFQMPLGVRDRRGRQLIYLDVQKIDFAVMEANLEHIVPYYNFLIESAMQDVKTQQRGVAMVMNMAGGFSLPSMSFMWKMEFEVKSIMMDLMLNRSGTRLGESYMLHPPWWMRAIWAVVHLVLSEKMRSRMKFLKDDEVDQLFEAIDPANVPAYVHPKGTLEFDFKAQIDGLLEKYNARVESESHSVEVEVQGEGEGEGEESS